MRVFWSITGLREVVARFARAGIGFRAGTLKTRLSQAAEIVVAEMQDQLSKGPQGDIPARGVRLEKLKLPKNTTDHLRRVTSRLIQSVSYDVKQIPGGWQAEVGPSRVEYAAIHEYGGTAGRGGSVEIPARPYAEPALEEARDRVLAKVRQALEMI